VRELYLLLELTQNSSELNTHKATDGSGMTIKDQQSSNQLRKTFHVSRSYCWMACRNICL